jgi:hypothetical protein
VASALEVRDRCGEPRPDPSTVADLGRKYVVVDLVTVRTIATDDMVSMEKDGFVDEFVLVVVVGLRRSRDEHQITGAPLRTGVEKMLVLHIDRRLLAERCARASRDRVVHLLAAYVALLASSWAA